MNTYSRLHNKAAAVVATTGAALMPLVAMATPTFDTAPIVTKITTYAGYAAVIVVAFIGARWGLRALGLIGHK